MRSRSAHLIAALLVAAVVLFLVSVLYRSEQERLVQNERLEIFHQLNTVSLQLETAVRTRSDISYALAAQVAVNPDIGEREFLPLARELMSHHTGIRSIQLARNSVVSHLYPFSGNEAALGLRQPFLPGQAETVRRAIETRKTVIAGPVELVQGGTAFISRTPIFISSKSGRAGQDRFWGLATVIIDKDVLIDKGRITSLTAELQTAIRGKDGLGAQGAVFYGEPEVFLRNPAITDVNLTSGTWQIAALPKKGWHKFRARLLWLWVAGGALAAAAGSLTFYVVRKSERLRTVLEQYRDIEQSLRLSEEKYRAVVDHANEGIAVAQDGQLRFVNPKLIALLGYSRQELLSQSIEAFLHPADRDLVMSRHRMRLRGDPLPPVYSFRVLDKKGAISWFELNAVVMTWDGRPAALLFLSDVTARKRTEWELQKAMDELEQKVGERTAALKATNDQLRASERKFRTVSQEFHTLLDGIADALMHIAPDMTVLWANRAAAAAVGRDITEMIGSYCYTLWHGRTSPCKECPVADSFQSGKSTHAQKTTADGRCWGVKAFPIRDDEGKVASVIQIAADISERIKLQETTARTRQLVSLGELAAGVAHEINNPLAGTALCFKELMQPDVDAATRETLARVIDAELVKMKNIVDRLLTFSRMSVTRKSPVNLNRLVESILILCRGQFSAKNVAITTDLAAAAPELLAEESKLEQVFINIMLNALHAMGEGGHLAIITRRLNSYCSIRFEDTGPGVPPEILGRIFEPFFTTRGDKGGTGLGLSISREIVEQHGGVIEVESRPGERTAFTVKLPLSAETKPVAAAEQDNSGAQGGANNESIGR